MPGPKVERVTERAILGEGPYWDSKENVLYWVDIFGGTVRKYNTVTKEEQSLKLGDTPVSFIIPIAECEDHFVIGMGHDINVLAWNGGDTADLETIATTDTDIGKEGNRVNDAKADECGRLWVGTMSARKGPGPINFYTERASLYSLTGRNLRKQLCKVNIGNGLEWSLDKSLFYFIDSYSKTVDVFDFNTHIGQVTNRRTVFDFDTKKVDGIPDGMTIDTDGKLWVACIAGSKVIRIDPETGTLLSHIPIPSYEVTSVAFGGPNLDELYVTTGHLENTEEQDRQFPWAGSTFLVTELDGVKGVLPSLFKFM